MLRSADQNMLSDAWTQEKAGHSKRWAGTQEEERAILSCALRRRTGAGAAASDARVRHWRL